MKKTLGDLWHGPSLWGKAPPVSTHPVDESAVDLSTFFLSAMEADRKSKTGHAGS